MSEFKCFTKIEHPCALEFSQEKEWTATARVQLVGVKEIWSKDNSSWSMHGNLLLVYVTTDHDSVGCSQIAEIMHSVWGSFSGNDLNQFMILVSSLVHACVAIPSCPDWKMAAIICLLIPRCTVVQDGPEKNGGNIKKKVHKWHVRNVYVRLVKGLCEPY